MNTLLAVFRLGVLFGILITLLLAGPTSAGASAEVAGCYEVSVGVYDDGSSLPTVPPPEHVELTVEPRDDGERDRVSPHYSVRTKSSSQLDLYRSAVWSIDGEVLRVIWWTGFTSLQSKLNHVEGKWVGEIRLFYDTGHVTKPLEISLTPEESSESTADP